MQITLEDCRWMDQLIKFHQVWNSGQDWCLGSPSYGLLKYVLLDHDVIITRSEHYLNPHTQGTPGVKTKTLQVSHVNLLLEAKWWAVFNNYSELYHYDLIKMKHEHAHVKYKFDVTWVGDADLFLEWLMEFKLWNSLTDSPVML
jgi:hypothetical protein